MFYGNTLLRDSHLCARINHDQSKNLVCLNLMHSVSFLDTVTRSMYIDKNRTSHFSILEMRSFSDLELSSVDLLYASETDDEINTDILSTSQPNSLFTYDELSSLLGRVNIHDGHTSLSVRTMGQFQTHSYLFSGGCERTWKFGGCKKHVQMSSSRSPFENYSIATGTNGFGGGGYSLYDHHLVDSYNVYSSSTMVNNVYSLFQKYNDRVNASGVYFPNIPVLNTNPLFRSIITGQYVPIDRIINIPSETIANLSESGYKYIKSIISSSSYINTASTGSDVLINELGLSLTSSEEEGVLICNYDNFQFDVYPFAQLNYSDSLPDNCIYLLLLIHNNNLISLVVTRVNKKLGAYALVGNHDTTAISHDRHINVLLSKMRNVTGDLNGCFISLASRHHADLNHVEFYTIGNRSVTTPEVYRTFNIFDASHSLINLDNLDDYSSIDMRTNAGVASVIMQLNGRYHNLDNPFKAVLGVEKSEIEQLCIDKKSDSLNLTPSDFFDNLATLDNKLNILPLSFYTYDYYINVIKKGGITRIEYSNILPYRLIYKSISEVVINRHVKLSEVKDVYIPLIEYIIQGNDDFKMSDLRYLLDPFLNKKDEEIYDMLIKKSFIINGTSKSRNYYDSLKKNDSNPSTKPIRSDFQSRSLPIYVPISVVVSSGLIYLLLTKRA